MVQVHLLAVVQFSQSVMKSTDRQGGVSGLLAPIKVGQRAVTAAPLASQSARSWRSSASQSGEPGASETGVFCSDETPVANAPARPIWPICS